MVGGGMSKVPKLKVRYDIEDERGERIMELEQARDFFYGSEDGYPLVVMEGQAVNSYKELIQLASQDSYRNKEFLKVELRSVVLGGG